MRRLQLVQVGGSILDKHPAKLLLEVLVALRAHPMVLVESAIPRLQVFGRLGELGPAECAVVMVPVPAAWAVTPFREAGVEKEPLLALKSPIRHALTPSESHVHPRRAPW